MHLIAKNLVTCEQCLAIVIEEWWSEYNLAAASPEWNRHGGNDR